MAAEGTHSRECQRESTPGRNIMGCANVPSLECSDTGRGHPDANGHFSGGSAPTVLTLVMQTTGMISRTTPRGTPAQKRYFLGPDFLSFELTLQQIWARCACWDGCGVSGLRLPWVWSNGSIWLGSHTT